jgi:hypothetical protein
MKRAVLVFLELIVFLVIFFVGSILPGITAMPMLSIPAGAGHIFVLDGLLLMLAFYVLLLLIGLARRRIAVSWQNPTIALILALVLGLIAKFGFRAV